jgi:uncharacterized protein YdhG (YjbR/CyaY superfamily)
MRGEKFQTVDTYLEGQSEDIKAKLQQIREVLANAVPEAIEVISYNMPAIKFKQVLVYYAATDKHIGYYPTSSGVAAFEKELGIYNPSKGTIRFPLDKPLPLDLITDIARYRYEEVLKKIKPAK